MKNRKIISILLLAIAALAAAEVALNVLGQKTRLASRTSLVDHAAEATSVTLVRRDEAATQLDLVDGTWRMTRPFAADVEQSVVLRLLDALDRATVTATMSDAELLKMGRTRASYSLEEPSLRVVLSNDVRCVALSFGTLLQSGEGVYAAVDGERSVLIVPLFVLDAADLRMEQLRRRRLFAFDAGDVESFSVKQAPGSLLSFARDGEGWRAGTDKAEASCVAKFLEDVTSARALDFVWPTGATNEGAQASAALLAGKGLDPETAVTVTFKRAGGRSASISFGGVADGRKDSVYALVHNGGAVVTVPSALKDAALQDAAWFVDARLFQVAAEKVDSIALADGAAGVSLSLGDDGAWRLDAPIAAPADAAVVADLLKRLQSLTAMDLDATGVSVTLGGAAKPVVVSRQAITGGIGGFENLRAKEVVDFADEDVKRLVSTRGDGAGEAVVYSKDRRAWNVEKAPDGAVVSDDGVAAVLAALSPLKATEVVQLKVAADELGKFGLEKPALRLAVDLDRANAVRRNILVGAETPDGAGRYATVGSADAVFVISRASFDALSRPLVK